MKILFVTTRGSDRIKRSKTIILLLLVFSLLGVVQVEAADLANDSFEGDNACFNEEIPVPAMQNQGLAGFFFDFYDGDDDNVDYEITNIETRLSDDGISLDYCGPLPTCRTYRWRVNRQELPPKIGTFVQNVH
jgi:hypothetical protein